MINKLINSIYGIYLIVALIYGAVCFVLGFLLISLFGEHWFSITLGYYLISTLVLFLYMDFKMGCGKDDT